MNEKINTNKLLLLFWGAWYFIAASSNLTDYLIQSRLIDSLSFSSGNYAMVEGVLSKYSLSQSLTPWLFPLIIAGEFGISFAFLLRLFEKTKQNPYLFACAWWCLFLIVDELFISYAYSATHGLLLALSLLSETSLSNAKTISSK
jgi:hypothetical protein